MIVYLGTKRETEVEAEIEDLGLGAGRTTCFECEGTGDWTRFHPENMPMQCVDCKGTGLVLVSI